MRFLELLNVGEAKEVNENKSWMDGGHQKTRKDVFFETGKLLRALSSSRYDFCYARDAKVNLCQKCEQSLDLVHVLEGQSSVGHDTVV